MTKSEQFKVGTVIELVSMNDPQAPPCCTKGTVRGIDAAGQIMVDWENGSGLSVIPGVDEIKVIGKK